MPSRRCVPIADLFKITDPSTTMMAGICGSCTKAERGEITIQGIHRVWYSCGYNNRNDRLAECRFHEALRTD